MTRPLTKAYTREEITEALTVVAWHNGRTTPAIRELRDRGYDTLARQVLDQWKVKHADIYEACLTKLDEQLADNLDDLARSSVDFQAQALRRLSENIDEMPLKDLTTAHRNTAVGMGIAIEKSALLRGKPTEITEHREPTKLLELMNQIAASAVPRAVDSTAEDLDEIDELEEANHG